MNAERSDREFLADRVAQLEAALVESEGKLRLLAEYSSDAVLMADPHGVIEWASVPTTSAFGWRPHELVGRSVFDLVHPDDLARNATGVAEVLAGRPGILDGRMRMAGGDYRWVSSRVTPVLDEDGTVLYAIAGWRNIHDERLALLALAEANNRLNELVDSSSDAVTTSDNSGVVTWASPSIRTLTGWYPDQLVGQRFTSFVHPDDLDMVHAADQRLCSGDLVTFEARIRTSVGDHRWISFHTRPRYGEGGVLVGRVAGLRDIQGEREARDELARSEERFRTAMRSAPIGMALVDLERRFVAVNPALCRLVGQPEHWLLTRQITEILDPLDHDLELRMRGRLLASDQQSTGSEMRLLHHDGRSVWVHHVVALVRGHRGEPTGFVSQFLDITEAVRVREQLKFQATHDALTRVGNREELRRRIADLLVVPAAAENASGVLFIDVDHLKDVNDSGGHHVGDAVLVEVAEAITQCTRADDVVVRYGGDEFVVVIPTAGTTSNLVSVAEKVREVVARRTASSRTLPHVTVSVGVALSQPLDEPEVTLHHADDALYRAKQNGRNRVEAYLPESIG